MDYAEIAREFLRVDDHYTVPDIKPSELFDQAIDNNEAFIEGQADRIRAIASLASSGFRVPFKTLCEALGVDYDQTREYLNAGSSLPPIEDIVKIDQQEDLNYTEEPQGKKLKKNSTDITEDMMNYLLK